MSMLDKLYRLLITMWKWECGSVYYRKIPFNKVLKWAPFMKYVESDFGWLGPVGLVSAFNSHYKQTKNVFVIEKTYEIWGWRLKAENLQTFYLNSKRSVQFLKQNAFSTCSWRFLRSNTLHRTIQIQIGKNNWYLKTYRKS